MSSILFWNRLSPSKEAKTPDEQEESQRIRELILTPFAGKLDVKVTYAEGVKRFLLNRDFFTVDEIVLDIERIFKNRDYERRHFDFGDGVVLDHVPGQVEIEQIIRVAMIRNGTEGDRLSLENKQQIDLFFYQSLPRGKKSSRLYLILFIPASESLPMVDIFTASTPPYLRHHRVW